MRRTALAALALALVAAPPARAAVSLGGAPDGLLALTAAGNVAYAVVGTRDHAQPFALVRSTGRGRSAPQRFGAAGAEFPDLAAAADGTVVAGWGRPVGSGAAYVAARVPAVAGAAFGAPQALATGTGPGRLALGLAGEPLVAFPDVVGDAILQDGDAPAARLTSTAPDRRHLPLDVAVDTAGRAFVLDLAQTRGSSELWLLGPGAPATAAMRLPALRDVTATLALDGGRAYVAWQASGRVRLAGAALAEPGGRWSTRRLPGRGGTGTPALVRTGGRTLVAYTRRQPHSRGRRDVFLADDGPHGVRVRRLTRTPQDERGPFAAASPAGDVFVGWSRAGALHGPATAVLVPVG